MTEFYLDDEAKFKLASEGVLIYDKDYVLTYNREHNLFSCIDNEGTSEFYATMENLLIRKNKLKSWYELYIHIGNKRDIVFETECHKVAKEMFEEDDTSYLKVDKVVLKDNKEIKLNWLG